MFLFKQHLLIVFINKSLDLRFKRCFQKNVNYEITQKTFYKQATKSYDFCDV